MTRPITGQLMDEYKENVVNILAFISFALSLFLLGITQNPIAFFISAILAGIGYGNLASTLQAVAVKVVPFHKIGLATATFFNGLDVGLGFGSFVLGMFTAKIGFANIYFCMGVLLVLTLIFYYFIHGKRMKNIYGKHLSQH
ncbi:MFS transporter [Staphylococcus delphini]|uniref:MFS transporter n=1 Tax=Staphylococcus delphini TaxID=53344 RepID=UPI0030B94ABB